MLVAAAVVVAAAAGVAYAAYPTSGVAVYTGCLNTGGSAGGQISNVAVNPANPLKPCGSNQTVVHLSGGTITSVIAGNGLSGGGSDGAVTVGLASGFSLPQSCANGQAPVESTNGWTCGNFANGDQSCSTGEFANGVGQDGSLSCGAESRPDAYFATNSHVIDSVLDAGNPNTSPTQDFVTLSGLPAGTYLVTGEVGLDHGSDDGGDLYCDFKTGDGQVLQPFPNRFKVPSSPNDVTATQTDEVTLPSDGQLILSCGATFAGKDQAYGTITALRVNAAN
jgi:hypothetical protein